MIWASDNTCMACASEMLPSYALFLCEYCESLYYDTLDPVAYIYHCLLDRFLLFQCNDAMSLILIISYVGSHHLYNP